MKPDLVSPDFCLLSVSLLESTLAILVYLRSLRYFQLTSKIQRIYQVVFDSSNHQRGIRVSYDKIFNCSGAFSPTLYAIVIVKRGECRNRVNIGYTVAKQR